MMFSHSNKEYMSDTNCFDVANIFKSFNHMKMRLRCIGNEVSNVMTGYYELTVPPNIFQNAFSTVTKKSIYNSSMEQYYM